MTTNKAKAPLASPDYSSVSNSSESPENQQNSDTTAKSVPNVSPPQTEARGHLVNGDIESEEENEDFLSDDFGSTLDSSFGVDFLKDSIAIATDRLAKEKLNNNNDIVTNIELHSQSQAEVDNGFSRQNGTVNGTLEEHLDDGTKVTARDSLELPNTGSKVHRESGSSGENTEAESTSTGSTIVLRKERSDTSVNGDIAKGDDAISTKEGDSEKYQVVMRPKSTATTRKGELRFLWIFSCGVHNLSKYKVGPTIICNSSLA